MLKTSAIGSLLLSTALYCVPAYAQQTNPAIQPPTGEQTAEPDTEGAQDEVQPEEQTDQEVEISTPGAGNLGEEIVVQGRFIPNETRNTASVISVLSAEDIARTGDGDIAGSLERVTGLSVDNGGFVYVRGLGDRYSQALLNGTPLPSPEPLKRVVPLDIFPTSVLSSAVVQKSYSVNYPGEFGGGVINLTSATLPDESFLTAGAGIGINTETTGDLGYTYYGSDSDWTGFDDGTRDTPLLLRNAFNSGARIEPGATFTNTDLQDIATTLVNADTSLLQRNLDIPANWSANISAGYRTSIGSAELGVTANAGFSNSWFTRDSLQQEGAGSVLSQDGREVRTDNDVVVSGLFGVGLDFGDQKLRSTTIFIRDTVKQGSLYAYDSISVNQTGTFGPQTPPDVIQQRTLWIERQLIDTVLSGEFRLGDIDLNMRGNYANSQRESPYQREFRYLYDPEIDDYTNDLQSQGAGATIAFADLNEDVWSGAIDVGYHLPTAASIVVSAGYAYNSQDRSAYRRDFLFLPQSGSLPDAVSQERPDFLLSDINIRGSYTPFRDGDGIILTEALTTAGSQAYDASLEVNAGYVKIEAEPVPFVTLEVGVRYETAHEQVTALDLFNDGTVIQAAPLDNDYFLPAATLTWNFAPDMQVRFNGSKTIARPQFRELARPLYIDPDNGRLFNGNPFLIDSELINAEARYEWYFGRDQRFTLAGFYKRIDNPIETIEFVSSGGNRTTFANAPEANLYGGEVEIVKYFDLANLGNFFETKRIFASANYTYTKSRIKVNDDDQTILPDNRGFRPANEDFGDGSPLTGQSEHLANLQLGFEDTERLQQVTFLLRYASERVTSRSIASSQRLPNYREKPGLKLDIVAREGFDIDGQEFELKFEARNITGTRYQEFRQGDQDGDLRIYRQNYDLGTTLAISAAAKF